MTAPTIVCVLGMHRSGTSVATRMLNLLGASLGPADLLLDAASDNPKGFWESRPIIALNNEILARLGGNCVRLPAFPAGWESAPQLDDLRDRARSVLGAAFGDATLWAWKDPRTCLTLPFWQRLLPPMRYVVCLRQPADVAGSLERRSGMPRERGIYLWLAYLQHALLHSAGNPRCFVYYDRLIDDLPRELGRLAQFLGFPERATQPEVRQAIESFVHPDLRHHLSLPTGAASRNRRLPSHAQRLAAGVYAAFACGEPLDEHDLQRTLARALDAVDVRAVPWLARPLASPEGDSAATERQVGPHGLGRPLPRQAGSTSGEFGDTLETGADQPRPSESRFDGGRESRR